MDQLLKIFKALSDKTRFKMVKLLFGRELCVCQIEAVFDVSQSRISQNLKILKDAGLVSERRDGKWVFYQANKELLVQEFQNLLQFIDMDPGSATDMKKEYERLMDAASKMDCD